MKLDLPERFFFSTNQIALGVNGRVMDIAVKKIFFSYRREEDFLFLSCLYVAAAGMGRFPRVQVKIERISRRPGSVIPKLGM